MRNKKNNYPIYYVILHGASTISIPYQKILEVTTLLGQHKIVYEDEPGMLLMWPRNTDEDHFIRNRVGNMLPITKKQREL